MGDRVLKRIQSERELTVRLETTKCSTKNHRAPGTNFFKIINIQVKLYIVLYRLTVELGHKITYIVSKNTFMSEPYGRKRRESPGIREMFERLLNDETPRTEDLKVNREKSGDSMER